MTWPVTIIGDNFQSVYGDVVQRCWSIRRIEIPIRNRSASATFLAVDLSENPEMLQIWVREASLYTFHSSSHGYRAPYTSFIIGGPLPQLQPLEGNVMIKQIN